MLDRKRRFTGAPKRRPLQLFSMALLEDANSVQVALMQVLYLLGCGQIEHKEAGLMLYGLQIASSNLKNTKFEPEKPTDVVIDRKTVDRTCIAGPQWFHREFQEPAAEPEKIAPEKISPEKISPEKISPEKIEREKVAVAAAADEEESAGGHRTRLRAQKRKTPDPAESETPGEAEMHDFLCTLIPNYDAVKARRMREEADREEHRC
jgi:hypothetical protein